MRPCFKRKHVVVEINMILLSWFLGGSDKFKWVIPFDVESPTDARQQVESSKVSI